MISRGHHLNQEVPGLQVVSNIFGRSDGSPSLGNMAWMGMKTSGGIVKTLARLAPLAFWAVEERMWEAGQDPFHAWPGDRVRLVVM